MESVFPVKDKGDVIVAEVTAPVPLPVRMPPSVVEPVPPLGTVSALVRVSVLIAAVPVAVSVATLRLPEMRPFPWTDKVEPGVVVPRPRRPPEVKTDESKPLVL